jgi:uncharacterized protein
MDTLAHFHVRIPMRDGTLLSADIYRPVSPAPCTAVLTRICYTKAWHPHRDRGAFWAAHGYAYLVQDVRGRGDSDGDFYPIVHEMEDGSDTIDWIASQSWSDGRVMMVGASYAGWTQVYAACSANPHLIALAPMATPADPDRGFPMSRGMIMPVAASWMAMLDGHVNQDLSAIDLQRAFAHRPIVDFDRLVGRNLQPWRDWVGHAVRDRYWEKQAYQTRLLQSSQHMLHVTGWYDDCLAGALENFASLSKRQFDADAGKQKLIVGPWLHGTLGDRSIGDLDFGEDAKIDLNELQRDWFAACVTDNEPETVAVRLFVMGRNAWINEREWPIARSEYVPYYLHSVERANTRNGDGTLSTEPPAEEGADTFQYDPANPVPYSDTFDWKQVGGPDDYAALELREDILVYTGPVLEQPLLVCGPILVKLFAATSARDTDWTAKLLEVYPDGRAIRLSDGAIRARFRKGHDRECFLTPGAIEEYDIDCGATCIELHPGHRLRLEISSSVVGKYDVNLNGGGPVGQETAPTIAEQTIYHDAARPSHIVLAVLRTG